MGENMVSDVSVQVLSERVTAVLDDIKEMKGKVDAMHVVSIRLAGVERDVVSVDRKAEVALSKTDSAADAISKIREDVNGTKKAWKWMGGLSMVGFAAVGGVYSQWHPWMDDINRAKAVRDESLSHYQADVGAEMRKTDNRLTVLEFRANNVDSKGSK
ncbi:hypothetical protein [Paraburkholderia fynbosensis]|nr:hypothetical protein [Paraburkholderia fynbosensis]